MKKLKLSAIRDGGIEVLTREQMNKVLGKMIGGSEMVGCTVAYMGCHFFPESGIACDYEINCPGPVAWSRYLCAAECLPGDGADCLIT